LGPISVPSTENERNYTAQQSARRKDIERAFGILKIKFNILNMPSQTGDITIMNRLLRVCTILHNMVTKLCVYETQFTDHVQVVEEKRIAVKESIYYSVADAVEDEAMSADQENRMESELTAIPFGLPGAKFESFAHYLKHLNDLQSHNDLRQSVSNHLWRSAKIQKTKIRLQRYQLLFDEQAL
jgi:hypothetical protein